MFNTNYYVKGNQLLSPHATNSRLLAMHVEVDSTTFMYPSPKSGQLEINKYRLQKIDKYKIPKLIHYWPMLRGLPVTSDHTIELIYSYIGYMNHTVTSHHCGLTMDYSSSQKSIPD